MRVRFNKAFTNQLGKYPHKVQVAFQKRLELFLNDSMNQLLSNHALTGHWDGYRSINVSGDLRAVYEMVDEGTAYFVAFGTHSQLYG